MTRRLIFLMCGAALVLLGTGCNDAGTYLQVVCKLNGARVESGNGYFRCVFPGGEPRNRDVAAAGSGRVDPVTATFKTRVVSAGRRRGRQVTGIRHKGTLRISPRGTPKRLLRGYTRARFASSGSLRVGGRNGLGRLQGYMWVTFPRGRGAACLRVDAQVIDLEGPPTGQLQFRSMGGTGRAARLSVIGTAPVSGSGPLLATWQVKRAKARRAPAACRKLARVR
jgi:hypothetical protein